MAATGLTPAQLAALLSSLQGPDTSGIGGLQGGDSGGGGRKTFDDFLSSPSAALLGQIVSGVGQGLLSRPSKEERALTSAQTERLGVGSAAQNSQVFQQLMQLLLRSSGRGGL